MGKFIDHSGKIYNRLKVVEISHRENGKVYWKCQCECGNIIIVHSIKLKTNRVKSCGCLKKETSIRNIHGKNIKYKFGEAAFNELFSRYKRQALNRGLSFQLDKEQFKILVRLNCKYCGRKPEQIILNSKTNGPFTYNGIDRLDNTKGYILENCVPCCKRCNRAKDTMNKEEFYEWIDEINLYRIGY